MFSSGLVDVSLLFQILCDEEIGAKYYPIEDWYDALAIVDIDIGLYFVPIWITTGPILHFCM